MAGPGSSAVNLVTTLPGKSFTLLATIEYPAGSFWTAKETHVSSEVEAAWVAVAVNKTTAAAAILYME